MPRTREQNYQVVTPSTGLIGGGANLTQWRAGTNTRYCRHPWTGIAWSPTLSLFAACASDGYVGVSTDGNDWLEASYPGSSIFRQWQSIVWCPVNGIFCVIANNAYSFDARPALQVLVSVSGGIGPPSWHLVEDVPPELRAWSALTVLTVDGTEAVCAVAGDDSGAIALSLDCHTWTEHFGATGEDNAYFKAACWNDDDQELQIVSDAASSSIFGSKVTMGLTGGVFNPTFTDILAGGSLLDSNTWAGVAWSSYLSAYIAVATYSAGGDSYFIYGTPAYWDYWPGEASIWPRTAVIYVPDFYMLYMLGADALGSDVDKSGSVTGFAASTDGTKFGQIFYTASGDRTLEYVEVYLVSLPITGTHEMYAEIWTFNAGLPDALIAQSDNICYVEGSGYYRFYFNKEHLFGSNYYVFSINGMTGVSYGVDTTYAFGNRVTYNGATWTGQANDMGLWKVRMLKEIVSGTNGWGTLRTFVWKANNVRQGIGDTWKAIAYAPEIKRFCAVGECGWTMVQDVYSDMENVIANIDNLIPELEFQSVYHDRIRAMHAIIGRIGQLGGTFYPGSSSNLVTLNGTKVFEDGFNFGQNNFNYYDNGTWTPASATSTGDGPAPITTNWARYTRIGNICFLDVSITWGSQTAAQIASHVSLSGLPYNRMANVRGCFKINRNKDTDQLAPWLNQGPMVYNNSPTVLHLRDPLDYDYGPGDGSGYNNGLAGQTTRISGFYFITV